MENDSPNLDIHHRCMYLLLPVFLKAISKCDDSQITVEDDKDLTVIGTDTQQRKHFYSLFPQMHTR